MESQSGALVTAIQRAISAFVFAIVCGHACAAGTNFSGHWTIDLRTPQERKQNVECGRAEFILKQVGDQIEGNHTFATVGCARMNEGGDGTVKGIMVGGTAVLAVTSGRNGSMVLGRATRSGNRLRWTVVDELKSGQPEGDSALILGKGTLILEGERKK